MAANITINLFVQCPLQTNFIPQQRIQSKLCVSCKIYSLPASLAALLFKNSAAQGNQFFFRKTFRQSPQKNKEKLRYEEGFAGMCQRRESAMSPG